MQPISQHLALKIFAADRASWEDIRHYPSTVVCRLMLRFADWSASRPGDAESARLSFECPELSYEELAVARGISRAMLCRQLGATVNLTDPDDFNARETECYEPWDCMDAFPFPLPKSSNLSQSSPTYLRAVALADFSRLNPERWLVLRCAYSAPELSQAKIAKITQVPQTRVSKILNSPIKLE